MTEACARKWESARLAKAQGSRLIKRSAPRHVKIAAKPGAKFEAFGGALTGKILLQECLARYLRSRVDMVNVV
jgi:hypothetical protein